MSIKQSIDALIQLEESRDLILRNQHVAKELIAGLQVNLAADGIADTLRRNEDALVIASQRLGLATDIGQLIAALDTSRVRGLISSAIGGGEFASMSAQLGTVVPASLAVELGRLSSNPEQLLGMKQLQMPEALSATIARSLALEVDGVSSLGRSIAEAHFAIESIQSPAATMLLQAGSVLDSLSLGSGIADLLDISHVTRSVLGYQTERLGLVGLRFVSDDEGVPQRPERDPPFVREAPGRIIWAQARFLRSVSTGGPLSESVDVERLWNEGRDEALVVIVQELPRVDGRLATVWEGVSSAATQRGPDWTRQAAASLRYLLVEVLNAVAPPDVVKRSGQSDHLLKEGRKRLAQVHWLCQPIQSRNYGKVVRADLDSTMAIVDAMNEAVHERGSAELEEGFNAMFIRSVLSLAHLLRLWRAR